MVALTQRDLPYLVLTEDPNLQAYRTDTVANVEPACPADGGDIICEQVSYAPLLDASTPGEASGSGDGGGQSAGPRGRRGDRLRRRRLRCSGCASSRRREREPLGAATE